MIMNFVEGLGEALPTFGGEAIEIETTRDVLNRTQDLISNINSTLEEGEKPIELTTEQEEAFEVGFGEELVRGMGGFVPMIAELAAVLSLIHI